MVQCPDTRSRYLVLARVRLLFAQPCTSLHLLRTAEELALPPVADMGNGKFISRSGPGGGGFSPSTSERVGRAWGRESHD